MFPDRAVASVMQGARQAEHEEAIGRHVQSYDNMQARANNMRKSHLELLLPYRNVSSAVQGHEAATHCYTSNMFICLG